MTTGPALDEAARDANLSARDVRVLVALVAELSPVDFTLIKEAALRRSLGIGRATLWRALSALVHHGYLERQSGGPGESSRYRIVWVRVSGGKRTDAA